MKKKVISLVLCFILTVVLVSGCAEQTPGTDTSENSGISTGEESPAAGDDVFVDAGDNRLFDIERISDVKAYGSDCGLGVLEQEDGQYAISGAVCYGLKMAFSYYPAEDGETVSVMTCTYLPLGDRYVGVDNPKIDYTGAELKEDISKFFDMIGLQFGITVGNSFFVASSADGSLLPNNDAASYDQVISGDAFIDFALLDETGYYWHLRSEFSEEGLVFLSFTNYFADEERIANGAHITLK